jgi:predicted ribosome quality control (RQC) complex YloA/Tae2 family protein
LDNLVLASVVRELSRDWNGGVLEELRQESSNRFRLRFARDGSMGTLVVSLRPELPWIGRPSRRWEGPRWSPDPFMVAASRALVGRRVVTIGKAPADRSVTIGLAEGRGLAVELAPHGGNLVLLDEGRVVSALRRGRSTASRLSPGAAYAPREAPPGRLDPFVASAAALDALLSERQREGEHPLEVLLRRMTGIGTVAANLVLAEAARSGSAVGAVLKARLETVLQGAAEPLLEAPEAPWEAVDRGSFLEAGFRLLPWRPDVSGDVDLVDLGSPSATAGLYYECVDAAEQLRARIGALAAIVRTEASRTEAAEARAREGAKAFAGADDLGRRAEAILAGLSIARRTTDGVVVPDPYDPGGAPLEIPAPPGVPLARVAEDLFRKQRRARRGVRAAAARAELLKARLRALDALAVRAEGTRGETGAEALEAELRALGIAVGLARSRRAARARAATGKPAPAGFRLLTSTDGFTILVGQTARDNDRLTFKVAAPDDVWLHASGVPGAHVVIRAAEKGTDPPPATLHEAARAAAWFSDARGSAMVDVQWTRRKHVRRARGAPAGTVLVKRFRIVRVRPMAPQGVGGQPD